MGIRAKALGMVHGITGRVHGCTTREVTDVVDILEVGVHRVLGVGLLQIARIWLVGVTLR